MADSSLDSEIKLLFTRSGEEERCKEILRQKLEGIGWRGEVRNKTSGKVKTII